MSDNEYELGGVKEEMEVLSVKEVNGATIKKHAGWKHTLSVSVAEELVSSDTETVTIAVVDGLEIARGTDPASATVLDYSGDVTLRVDGVETTKTLTNGTIEFDVTTEKPAGSEIVVEAVGLSDHPAESDSATIEVIQA